MDMKKEQERAKLHSTIWKIANDLRGSVDGWDFKQYVLGMLLYRFISENLTNYINTEERKTGDADFSYATLSDDAAEFGRKDTVNEKGFYILPSELFENMRKRAKNDANLNETLTSIFRNIENSAKGAESEDDIKGLFDDIDVNSNKLGSTVEKRNKQVVKLLEAVGELQLGSYQDNTIDAFGDAYEYLMGMYASNAGKSGGEYYTPQEVSELLARITVVGKTEVNKVYDPAVGSGSLLLQFAKILGKENVRQGFYGQEININTYNLCRINMILHDINYEKFSIAHGDTLIDPSPEHWDEEPFEAIVSNPPYSIHWEGDSNPLLINDPRFSPAGVLAPKSKADLAFTMHILSWLSTTGTAAIVEFPGVLYRTGAEQKIRKYLIENNFVDSVIQLPADLFFGVTIATCIIVLKKSKKDNSTLFIDASEEFVRSGSKNKLNNANIAKILETFTKREDIEHFAKLIPNSEIAKNSYNIAVDSYIDKSVTQEIIDIDKLNAEIAEIVAKEDELRKAIDATIVDYENYVNKTLLGSGHPAKDIKIVTLDNVAESIIAGGDKPKQFSKLKTTEFTIPVYANGSGGRDLQGFTNKARVYKPSVTISARGTIGYAAVRNEPFLPIGRLLSITPSDELDVNYLYHIVTLYTVKGDNGGIPQLTVPNLKKITIPVPPISEQRRIVSILDKFEKLLHSNNEGLSAELTARRKQYEYYRTKLLTLQELDA